MNGSWCGWPRASVIGCNRALRPASFPRVTACWRADSSNGVLRASQLDPLKLQFFSVQPQYLNGLLTVAEWHQLEVAPNNLSSHVSIFTAGEPLAQRFTRLAEQTQREGLPVRCGLLQLWANAFAGLLPAPTTEPTERRQAARTFPAPGRPDAGGRTVPMLAARPGRAA